MQPVESRKQPARPVKRVERVVTRSQTRTSVEELNGLTEECQHMQAIIDQFQILMKKVHLGRQLDKEDHGLDTSDTSDEEAAWNRCSSLLDQEMDVDALEQLEAALEPQHPDPVMLKFLEDRKAAVSFFIDN